MLILAIRCGKGAMTRIRIDLVLPSDYNHNETIDQLNLSYPCDIYFSDSYHSIISMS